MLGDCYFLSVLAALAEHPHRIKKLFDLSKTNVDGIWSVKMFKNGLDQEIVMDNFIPCLYGSPVFSKANCNELWVIILEKAWAKLHKSYERIIWG